MRLHVPAGIALLVAAAGCGGGRGKATIPPEGITRVVLSTTMAAEDTFEAALLDPDVVKQIVQAVNESKPDSGHYVATGSVDVKFLKDKATVAELKSTGSVFTRDDRQYRDGSGVLARIIGGVIAAQAPLVGSPSCPETGRIGEPLNIEYTVKNAGDVPVTVASEPGMKLLWAKRDTETDEPSWTSDPGSELDFPLPERQPVTLKPGESHTYLIPVPTQDLPEGEVMLNLRLLALSIGYPGDEKAMPPLVGIVVRMKR